MSATERLDQWAALADAATGWKWRIAGDTDAEVRTIDGLYVAGCGTRGLNGSDQDAAFIAASREAVPAMIAALRAVLAVHAPNGMPVNRCIEDRLPYDLCPTVRAISSALGVQL